MNFRKPVVFLRIDCTQCFEPAFSFFSQRFEIGCWSEFGRHGSFLLKRLTSAEPGRKKVQLSTEASEWVGSIPLPRTGGAPSALSKILGRRSDPCQHFIAGVVVLVSLLRIDHRRTVQIVQPALNIRKIGLLGDDLLAKRL